jgi:hypothetical protein
MHDPKGGSRRPAPTPSGLPNSQDGSYPDYGRRPAGARRVIERRLSPRLRRLVWVPKRGPFESVATEVGAAARC